MKTRRWHPLVVVLLVLAACGAGIVSVATERGPSRRAREGGLAALEGYLHRHGGSARCLAIVDYSRPSFSTRMLLIDMDEKKERRDKEHRYRVAHGENSGGVYARDFSNEQKTHKSSLGLFRVTGEFESDSVGTALRLEGLDRGLNDSAKARGILLHGVPYAGLKAVAFNMLRGHGPRLGRTLGCFGVRHEDYPEIAKCLKDDGYIYAFADDLADGR